MAYTFLVNTNPTTGAFAIYSLIATLVAAGWSVKADSDGTTYAPAGGQVTGGNTGANGLNNANAWIRVQSPGTNGGTIAGQTREFTFQRGATSRQWRIKYSASAGFTGGAPATAVTPSSADELIMIGSATDAAPGFNTWFLIDQTYRWHIAAGGGAENYSFCAWAVIAGTSQLDAGIFLDIMQTGSYPAGLDVDPAVVFASGATGNTQGMGMGGVFCTLGGGITNATNSCLARAWLGATSAVGVATVGTNNQGVAMVPYGDTSGCSMGGVNSLGTNPWNNADDFLPAWWMRPAGSTAPLGLKGCSTLFLYGSVTRESMITNDLAAPGAKDKVCFAGGGGQLTQSIWAPWAGIPAAI